jgi:restriction system protein
MVEMPTWEEFIIPTLRVMSDGVVRNRRDLCPLVAEAVGIDDDQMRITLSSGQRLYENRIGWGLSLMANVGGLERPSRGHYQITEAGKQLIELFPEGVRDQDIKALGEDPNSPIRLYVPTTRTKQNNADSAAVVEESAMTPIEQVQSGIERIHAEVAAELLTRLQGKDPGFFEQAVVDLLLAMGYGGTAGAGSVTQLSNDGGIDGVIDQDILGLNRVYIQAKRYQDDNTVGRPDLQAFVGALSGKADRGVFITTSRFSDNARAYAENVPTRIILIDGKRLTNLMIRYSVGVQVKETYKVVEIDEDFFA